MEDKLWIFGRHPVIEALQAGQPIDKVWLQQGTRGEFEKELRHLCKDLNVPMTVLARERLNGMVKGNHQGVVAQLAAATYYTLENVVPGIFERGETPLLLILDGVTDVRNLGAIARSAEICGVHALVIPQKGSAGVTAEAVKTSAGALSRLPVCREKSLVNAINYLQASGIEVLASDLSGTQYLHEFDLQVPLALVLGSEGEGISKSVAHVSDNRFRIPQVGELNSFNVSVAAGIMLYEAMQQRRG